MVSNVRKRDMKNRAPSILVALTARILKGALQPHHKLPRAVMAITDFPDHLVRDLSNLQHRLLRRHYSLPGYKPGIDVAAEMHHHAMELHAMEKYWVCGHLSLLL